jgi:hypothetical protein
MFNIYDDVLNQEMLQAIGDLTTSSSMQLLHQESIVFVEVSTSWNPSM